jgi:glycine cleavage system H protein
MNVPDDLLYTEEHEWVQIDEDSATIGITDYAQQELGDVVFVELPDQGLELEAGQTFGSVESVKAVSEIYAPLSGSVTEINEKLEDSPETVNDDPYGDGWMIRLEVAESSEISELMSAADYQNYLEEEAD